LTQRIANTSEKFRGNLQKIVAIVADDSKNTPW